MNDLPKPEGPNITVAGIKKIFADNDDLRAEIERLLSALEQIAVCCTDNMGPECDHRITLDFVRQIANDALEQKQIPDTVRAKMQQLWNEIERLRAAQRWETFSGTTPIDKWIMLWFVGNNAPKSAHMPVIGLVSSHEPGKVWDGHDYRPVEWFSHWKHFDAPSDDEQKEPDAPWPLHHETTCKSLFTHNQNDCDCDQRRR